MSFYDLTKDIALSARDLFKYRVKRDSTIPSRGGQKDFEPDGSWLQSKAVEAFIQERTSVLSEPRVEKLKSLVQGTWEPDKKLVNVDKTGKFWAHMGFTDNRRNWLYPEEALFLMETNSLEVYYEGIPLSIQEAYSKFLSGSEVSIEEYQVFAHLRRLGFVVLRHEEQPILTDYERKINLDKYIGKQTLKERKSKFLKKKKGGEHAKQDAERKDSEEKRKNSNEQTPEQPSAASSELRGDDPNKNLTTDANTVNGISSSAPTDSPSHCVSSVSGKRQREEDDDATSSSSHKKLCSGNDDSSLSDSSVNSNGNKSFYDSSWSSCFNQILSRLSNPDSSNEDKRSSVLQQTSWSADAFPLPNIAGKDLVSLQTPAAKLLPPNVEFTQDDQDLFDVEEYRIKHPTQPLNRQAQREEERDTRIRSLNFSFAEWTQRKPNVKATNWAEYKTRVAERMQELASSTPVDHLWQGDDDVQPLVHPKEATSFGAVLSKLSIVQSLENKNLEPESTDEYDEFKISYDVHLPDHQFKKSMPGVPNHRVCVTKCDSDPLSLSQIQQYWHMYKDDVPLHCAVVDAGEIAFYIFDNLQTLETLTT